MDLNERVFSISFKKGRKKTKLPARLVRKKDSSYINLSMHKILKSTVTHLDSASFYSGKFLSFSTLCFRA